MGEILATPRCRNRVNYPYLVERLLQLLLVQTRLPHGVQYGRCFNLSSVTCLTLRRNQDWGTGYNGENPSPMPECLLRENRAFHYA